MSSKSKASEPSVPLISMRIAFLRPRAKRVASKDPIAPESKRAVNRAASSTVTGPVSAPPLADRPLDCDGSGRSFTKVSVSPDTPVMDEPSRCWARSMTCAPMSPSAPDPALSFCRRHTSGKEGSTIQSCRYEARTCRIVPSRPSSTSCLASAIAGTRR